MSASFSSATEWSPSGNATADDRRTDRVFSDEVVSYCVSAVPAAYVATEDLIIRDQTGRSFLLTLESTDPVPLGRSELNVLGMAYEPAQDTSWHTAEELRRMFFGANEA